MSFQKDIDEYTEKELNDELERRNQLRDQGKCDYCQQYGNTPPCKFPERHKKAEHWWNNVRPRNFEPEQRRPGGSR